MERKIFKFNSIELPALYDVEEGWLFHGIDICEFADLAKDVSNSSKLIKKLPIGYFKELSLGEKGRPPLYVTEAGLYELIFRSKTIKGIKFKRWVLEKVLPSIRRQGIYYDESRFSEQEKQELESIIRKRDERIAELENQLENEQTKTFHMANYIQSEPERLQVERTKGFESGKTQVLEDEKTRARIDWEADASDSQGDPVIFAKAMKKQRDEVYEKLQLFGRSIYQLATKSKDSHIKKLMMSEIETYKINTSTRSQTDELNDLVLRPSNNKY